jgi:putative membrane-bound dehydrogenase-like protein
MKSAFLFATGLCVLAFGPGLDLGEAGEFPVPHDTQKSATRPLAASEAAAQWKFPEGFQVSVFAAEPDVRQPIAMALDDRGRLWVAENYTYAEVRKGFEAELRDRILIFEDVDGDGRFDRRTVFADDLQRLTSIELGFGGVWALASPALVFLPDRNGDDRPDGPPEVKLDGFEWQRNHHTLANGLRWGPDGWLYGRHGIQAVSEIGVPGTPAAKRARTNGGIWRYHPQRQAVEIVCHGTTNPWGLDWNDRGEPFFINTVIGHLWHVIPGAHYRRMHGVDLIPNVYEVIDQHADHVHWAVAQENWNSWQKLGTTPATSAAGGGHAHTGLLFYQGDNWPASWRGKLLTINYNGRRLNVDEVVRTPGGSGYVGRHQPDIGFSADPWFRGIDLVCGADGGVFIADWSDTGECHDDDGVYRNSGRIYKITQGRPKAPAIADVGQLSPSALVPLLDQPNEFFPRHARRRLQELGVQGDTALRSVNEALLARFQSSTGTVERLRALWSLQAAGGADRAWLRNRLDDGDEHIRAWAIRLLVDDPERLAAETETLSVLGERASVESSPFVRLALASALQRMPLSARPDVARSLGQHSEDAADHNLPLMVWYGIEPLAESEPAALAELGLNSSWPLVRRCIARRLMQQNDSPAQAKALAMLLSKAATDLPWQPDVLAGLRDALKGQRNVTAPLGWKEASPAFAANKNVGPLFRALGVIFADRLAREALRQVVTNATASTEERRSALRSLIEGKADQLTELCASVLTVAGLSPTAAEGLALEVDPANAERVLARMSEIAAADRSAVLGTVLSRPAWAERVLQALAAGRLARSELTAYHARQIRGFKRPELDRQLTEVWGSSRETGAEHLARINQWKKQLTPAILAKADRAQGRAVFNQVCGTCHVLNGEGGRVGPELTGSARDNLDYLLQNIVDPSAVVPREFQLVTLDLKDGRSLSGYIRSRDEKVVVLQTLSEPLSLPVGDIASTMPSTLSLMPEGLLDPLPEPDVRALIAYLMTK